MFGLSLWRVALLGLSLSAGIAEAQERRYYEGCKGLCFRDIEVQMQYDQVIFGKSAAEVNADLPRKISECESLCWTEQPRDRIDSIVRNISRALRFKIETLAKYGVSPKPTIMICKADITCAVGDDYCSLPLCD
ncbi:hypothetical protein [uncultured Aliiroseovarius sp.]|uniref:hypothetical protein n=1 Tax=uncultured Aliiroseovarius sp. TaxID=1658783 RepID=UPI002616F79A|nr:hypothetical protein [uncultured Aliiroseovarius sp.]